MRTWDDLLARASGIAAIEAIGRPLADVIPSIAARGLLARFDEVITAGTVHVFSPGLHHYLLPCPPSVPSARFEQMQQRVTLGPLRSGDDISGVMVAIEDVTERLEAERDLSEALAAGRDDWQARRRVVEQLSQRPSADLALSLVDIIRAHHEDFSVLNSSLQLLAGTGLDVSEALAELLRDPDANLRIQAALALGEQRAPAAQDALIRALDDPDDNVRFQAIESLGRLRAGAAVDHLVRIAESDDASLAFAAIDALGVIKDPRVASVLVPLLGNDALRPAVVSALGSIGDEAAVSPLVHALNTTADAVVPVAEAIAAIYHRLEQSYQQGAAVAHVVAREVDGGGIRQLVAAVEADPAVAPQVVRVLGWVQSDGARAALVRWLAIPQARETVLDVLPAHGEAVVTPLVQQLAAADHEVRRAAVVALGRLALPSATSALAGLIDDAPDLSGAIAGALARIADPNAFEGLVKLLSHGDAGVRHAAVGALNSLGHPAMPSRMVALLDSSNPLLRESAVRVAGYFGYPEARDRVLQLTSDPVEAVQCAAIDHVPFFDGAEPVDVLLGVLEQGRPGPRAAAARALGRMDDERARQALVRALGDGVLWVRYYAAHVLAAQRHAGGGSALRSAALHDPAPPVRVAAVEALTVIDPAGSADVLVGLARDRIDELAAAAVSALAHVGSSASRDAVRQALYDDRRGVRLAALGALAAAADGETSTLLHRAAATDREDDVRRAAVDALSEVARRADRAGDDAIEVLVGMLTDAGRGQDAAAALTRLPASRFEAMARHLHHPDPSTRRAVVETLGRSRHSEATILLLDALTDDAAAVREAAVLALERRQHVV